VLEAPGSSAQSELSPVYSEMEPEGWRFAIEFGLFSVTGAFNRKVRRRPFCSSRTSLRRSEGLPEEETFDGCQVPRANRLEVRSENCLPSTVIVLKVSRK